MLPTRCAACDAHGIESRVKWQQNRGWPNVYVPCTCLNNRLHGLSYNVGTCLRGHSHVVEYVPACNSCGVTARVDTTIKLLLGDKWTEVPLDVRYIDVREYGEWKCIDLLGSDKPKLWLRDQYLLYVEQQSILKKQARAQRICVVTVCASTRYLQGRG